MFLVVLLALTSCMCAADDFFGDSGRARQQQQQAREQSADGQQVEEDPNALVLWLEDRYIWIADQFWSNVVQVMLLGHISLALILFVRRRYRLAHERRWNKVHGA